MQLKPVASLFLILKRMETMTPKSLTMDDDSN